MSPNAKEGIKVGLAIVITYGLALRFEWMSSTWAAIAVAFIAQPGYLQELRDARGRTTVPVLRITSPDGNERWMPESSDIVRYLQTSYGQVAA